MSAFSEGYKYIRDNTGAYVAALEGEDVAKCVIAAASGLLDFGTGTVLNADGGFHLRRL